MVFEFHLRKLLQHEHGCSKPSPEIHHLHIHALQIGIISIACFVGLIMFICTVSITLRNYYSRRQNHSRRSTSILFNVHGDSSHFPNSDDEVERVIDHPIWHIRTIGLQQSVIDSITVFKYRKDEGLSLIDGTECSVCLCEFQHDESLKLLPKCSHAFHIPCIDTWLTSHNNCPLCRAHIVIDASITVVDQQRDLNASGEPLNQETHQIIDNFDHRVAVEGSDNDDKSGISIGEISDKVLNVRRSVSVDSSSSASVIFHDEDVVERSLSLEIHFGEKSNSNCKDVSETIGKNGRGKLKRALQKRTVSMRRSFSHNRIFLFSRHCRSQSLTLPL